MKRYLIFIKIIFSDMIFYFNSKLKQSQIIKNLEEIMDTSKETPYVREKSMEEKLLERFERLEQENAQMRAENERLKQDNDSAGIPLDTYIEVMSLIPYKLNLTTEEHGRGRKFSFTRFGEVKRILYNDLASIFENYRSFMEQGYFYILNPKVIRKHGLDDIYEKLLTKEKMEQVINCEFRVAVKFYESATPLQRETINMMLIEELKKDSSGIDFNVVSQISKICDKDLLKLAEESKQLDAVAISN